MEDALGRLVAFRAREAAKQRARRTKCKANLIPVEKKSGESSEKSGEPPQKPTKLRHRVLHAIPSDKSIKAGDLVRGLGVDRRAVARVLEAGMKSGNIVKVSRGNYQRVARIAA